MGNKQKSLDSNINKTVNVYYYLLCPNCWEAVPDLTIFIESKIPKIKISCICFKDKKNFLIMNLEDYITQIKTHKYLNNCSCNKKNPANFFCMNCETFSCDSCNQIHKSNFSICEEILNEKNLEIQNCKIHVSKPEKFFCKECQILYCEKCFLNHNIKIKKEHKGINILLYLDESKIKTKTKKYEIYQNEIIKANEEIVREVLQKIENSPNLEIYKDKINGIYKNNSDINGTIINFIELLLQNCGYFNEGKILNKNFICNVIKNTCFNLNNPKNIIKNDIKQENIVNQIECIINYFKSNFINFKLNSNIYENPDSKIDQNNNSKNDNNIKNNGYLIHHLCLLKNNKFASVDHGSTIRIYNNLCEVLFTLIEHTNNVTSIILLNSTENQFATCSDDNTIKIWDFEIGKCIKTIDTEGSPFMIYEKLNQKNQIGCLPFRNSINIYLIDSNETKIIFNKSFEKIIPWIEGMYQFPNDGRIILSATGFFEIFTENLEEIKKISINKETPKIFLYLENGDLAVGLLGVEIFIYDKNLIFKSRLIGYSKAITSIIKINN